MARDGAGVEHVATFSAVGVGGGSRMDLALQMAIGAVLGYLFGMIPTGAVVGRRFGIDLTRVGSGSTGATNVLRTLGARWAALVLLGDLLKGTAAVLLTGWILGGAPWSSPTWGQIAAAALAVIGHSFSPLLGFRGGKGIITGGGGLLVLSPLAFVAALASGVVAVALTRYVSVGSIVGAAVAGAIVVWQSLSGDAPGAFVIYGTLVPGFVFWTHRGNIQRLLSGTERKLSRGTTNPNRPVA
jgi:glycerol-3-phosphate acyltransferase PlsY